DVQLRLVSNINELGNPDAIILAGSKGTIADFVYLQKKGFGEEILAKAAAGTQIIGICGGFQMLGEFIEDPLGIESPNGSIRALGLLKATTTMAADKTLKRVETIHLQERLAVSGYEIHHGNTINNGSQVIFENDGDILGLASESGTVWGTYLHGIFDDDKFRRHLLNKLRRNKGLSPIEAISPYNLEPAFDLLAEKVRESVDMKAIYKKMGL
ncbi:MAG: hypothetical protein HRT88_09755, partial [Lentisphaeraceae bacterium]|nr:hypothetical protein [Lentisphaeraceae bacterium]